MTSLIQIYAFLVMFSICVTQGAISVGNEKVALRWIGRSTIFMFWLWLALTVRWMFYS